MKNTIKFTSIAIAAVALFILLKGFILPKSEQAPIASSAQINITSTNPSPLEGATVLQNGKIEITFNKPLENVPEFKTRIDPEINYKVELTADKKTVIIYPQPSWQLGTEYSLFILPDTKFEGKKTLNKEAIYHFQTIKYKGV